MDTTRVKKLNVAQVKTALKAADNATKLEIAGATGLSVATCGTILNELLRKGEVLEIAPARQGGGRPAQCYRYNARYAYAACAYFAAEGAGVLLRYAVANLLGEITEQGDVGDSTGSYEELESLFDELLSRYPNIKGIGVGVPGVVVDGRVESCDIASLTGVAVTEQLERWYNIGAVTENDMNAVAYGFYKARQYAVQRNVAAVFFPRDHCPGAGIVVNGGIVRGDNHFAGEISCLPHAKGWVMYRQDGEAKREDIQAVAQTIASIAAVINPIAVALTVVSPEDAFIQEVKRECLVYIPPRHMPELVVKTNIYEDYINGLIALTLERLEHGP